MKCVPIHFCSLLFLSVRDVSVIITHVHYSICSSTAARVHWEWLSSLDAFAYNNKTNKRKKKFCFSWHRAVCEHVNRHLLLSPGAVVVGAAVSRRKMCAHVCVCVFANAGIDGQLQRGNFKRLLLPFELILQFTRFVASRQNIRSSSGERNNRSISNK